MDLPLATFTLWQREARAAAVPPISPVPSGPAAFARVDLVPALEERGAWPTLGEAAGSPAMTVVVRGGTGVTAEVTGVDPGTAVQLVRLALPWIR